MNEQHVDQTITPPEKEETFFLLSELHKSPHLTQRALARKLNMSLGKTNYLIRELIKKGALKAKNFSHNPGKLGKVKYYLTKKGIETKIGLTYLFLKKKEAEYNHIKKEWLLVNNSMNSFKGKEIKKVKASYQERWSKLAEKES